jgi:hypothetical protein
MNGVRPGFEAILERQFAQPFAYLLLPCRGSLPLLLAQYLCCDPRTLLQQLHFRTQFPQRSNRLALAPAQVKNVAQE